MQIRKCHDCSLVANSNDFYPPKLPHAVTSLPRLSGDWISRRCEVRQYGQFLTRHLTFYSDQKSWQGRYDFFKDPLCSVSSFSLSVKGSYDDDGESKVIFGAKNYRFRISRLKVTLQDKMMVNNFNFYSHLGCGIPKSWRLNIEQDVTSSGGCVILGISLPNIEFEIMKMEKVRRKLHLFIGQRPTDGKSLSTHARRPTSFQEPLVRCKNKSIRKKIKTKKTIHKKIKAKKIIHKKSNVLSNEIPTFEMLKQLPINIGNQYIISRYLLSYFVCLSFLVMFIR